ncbi:MAG: LysM peptidoglycan-binding domain-containing protein [Deltaproteobacteria bacterium]|nr:LysM peptidoglycan-binding domain-containing protein [Deltaproteobacteria bacterium]
MNIKAIKLSVCSLLLVTAIGVLLIVPSMTYAQKVTHTVEKGDTLWDICERYYGDPNLWPKLWQMNPFITNPHLINPGDVITLFEKEIPKAIEKAPDKLLAGKVEIKDDKSSPRGYDIKDLVNINCIAYLSNEPIDSWGTILATDSERLILSQGEQVYVLFDREKKVMKGDEFFIIKPFTVLQDPKNKISGYSFSVHGILLIDKPSAQVMLEGKITDRENVYSATITDMYSPIQIGDHVLPYEPVSPCVLPQPGNRDLLGNIVASKDQQQLLGKGSVVYINRGFNHGVNRGNLLEIVNANIMPDPDPDPPGVRFLADERGRMIFPDVHIGIALVLESRPDTSTAIILASDNVISYGSFVKNMEWKDAPGNISLMPRCPIE